MGSATRGLWAAASLVTFVTSGQKLPEPLEVLRNLRKTWEVLRRTRPRHVAWTLLWIEHALAFSAMFTGSLPLPVRMGSMVLAFASGSAVGFVWSSRPPRRRMVTVALASVAATALPATLTVAAWVS